MTLDLIGRGLPPDSRVYRIELLREDWRRAFARQDMFLIGSPEYGAIATRAQLESFASSFAYLRHGAIYRHDVKIGEPSDIRIIALE